MSPEPVYEGQPLSYWLRLLKDKRRHVRKHALEGLQHIGPEASAAIPTLIDAFREKDAALRDLAVSALGRVGPAAVPALVPALRDDDEMVRSAAAGAIGAAGSGCQAAIAPLTHLLKDVNASVRVSAAEALWQVTGTADAAVPALIEIFRNPKGEDDAQSDAAAALTRIGPAAVPDLKALLPRATDELRQEIFSVLEDIVPDDPDVVRERQIEEDDDDEETEKRFQVEWKPLAGLLLATLLLIYRGGRALDLPLIYWGLFLLLAADAVVQTLVARAAGLVVYRVESDWGPRLAKFPLLGVDWTLKLLPIPSVYWGKPYDPETEDADEPVRMWWKVLIEGAAAPTSLVVGFLALAVSAWIGRTEPKYLDDAAQVGWCRPASSLEQAGLRRGDEIVSVTSAGQTEPTANWRDLLRVFGRVTGPVTLEIRRGTDTLSLAVDLERPPLFDVCHDVPPRIGAVASRSAGQTLKLRVGDRLIAVDQKPVVHWLDMKMALFGPEGSPPTAHTLTIERQGKKQDIAVPAELLGQRALGLRYWLDRPETVRRDPADACAQALTECWEAARTICLAALRQEEYAPAYKTLVGDNGYRGNYWFPPEGYLSRFPVMMGLAGVLLFFWRLIALPFMIVLASLETIRGRSWPEWVGDNTELAINLLLGAWIAYSFAVL